MAVKDQDANGAGDSSQSQSRSHCEWPRPKDKKSHYLAKTLLKGSAVLHAVYAHLRSPTSLDVVLGKESSLELLVISEDGIVQSVCEQTVFGKVKDLAVLPWNPNCRAFQAQTYGRDLLAVLSDSGKLSFLTFNVEMHRFLAVVHINLSQSVNARKSLGQKLAVESKGCAVAVAAFEDNLAVFPVTAAAASNIVEEPIMPPEEPLMPGDKIRGLGKGLGAIWSMCFISCEYEPSVKRQPVHVLAVLLHRKGAADHELDIFLCDSDVRTIHLMSKFSFNGSMALNVLEIPFFPGFALLLRIGEFTIIDLRDPGNPCIVSRRRFGDEEEADEEGSFSVAASALLELSDSRTNDVDTNDVDTVDAMCIDNVQNKESFSLACICSWSWEPKTSGIPRLAYCLDTGEILIADFLVGGQDIVRVVIGDIRYKCSQCNSLLWTKGNCIAAFVEMGDGQVLKMTDERLSCVSLIQNIAPILDMTLVDYHNEKQDQMFACCGNNSEGSIRIIRNGISVEKLLSTPAIYQGVTGIWTMRIKHTDPYHSLLVISFVEETRVLSVGLNFVDVTDAISFQPHACTLACGLVEDGWIAQVCRNEVRLCNPRTTSESQTLAHSTQVWDSWKPEGSSISLGAVSWKSIVLAMSSPGVLLMLGIRSISSGGYELYPVQKVKLEAEVSCISIPQKDHGNSSLPMAISDLVEDGVACNFPSGVEIGKVFIVGTHKPSVELLSLVPGEYFSSLAVGHISLTNTMGTVVSGCIPQDVRLVLFDRLYILSGLRNGMLLRFEWPPISTYSGQLSTMNSIIRSDPGKSSFSVCYDNCFNENKDKPAPLDPSDYSFPAQLQLVAVRRVGITPVFLVPIGDSLCSDVIALSDRPWLIQTARHRQRISYTSISFQPATHVTPVCTVDCPKGILFVADCCLHLVEMVHTKKLNVQKLMLKSTPRKVLYHSDSKTLLVMRTEVSSDDLRSISEISCIDPLSGSILSSFKLDKGEVGKSICLWKIGNDNCLVVGTALCSGRPIMSSGEATSARGRLLIFHLEPAQNSLSGSACSSSVAATGSSLNTGSCHDQDHLLNVDMDENDDALSEGVRLGEGGGWQLVLKCTIPMAGIVLAICPYLEHYLLASAGNSLLCLGIMSDSPLRLRKWSSVKTRFAITCISVHLTRIAVGDSRDGILFYSYQEDIRRLEQLYCDPAQRLVADCVLTDLDTAAVSDRIGNFCALTSPCPLEENASPERNLTVSCWYHFGESIMRMRKGSLTYKLPLDDGLKACTKNEIMLDGVDSAIVASTLLGSVVIFIQLSREDYELLDAVQARLASFSLTAPVLGNNHSEFRGRGSSGSTCQVLDGDMLFQFLELTSMQQQVVLSGHLEPGSFADSSAGRSLPAEQVLWLLERVHTALN